MSKLQIIIASTRPTRSADLVAPWVIKTANAHSSFQVEVLDLRDWPLPFFAEHMGTIGDFNNPTYSDPIVKAWNQKIREADAYLIITPEYNHSIPAVLKNAIDSVFVSFALRNKPMAAVSYSVGIAAGVRAVEHLALIAIETEAIPLRNTVIIPHVTEAFDDDGNPKDPMAEISLEVVLDDLAWWSTALEHARGNGELAPGTFRARAALAALAANNS